MNIFYYLIILITVLDFAWTQYLAYRNRKRMSPEIPLQLQGIYDKKEYAKQQDYQKENSRFGLISGSVSFIIILLILVFQGFGWLDGEIRQYIQTPLLVSLAFIGILFIANEIISLPFSYYDTFVIENKYGFNKATPKIFWIDQVKGLLLSVVLGGIILSALIWFYTNFGNYAWLYAWGLVTAFSLFMTLFYSNIIVPLFNKQTPLEDGELRNAIEDFSRKAGFDLTNIYVIDASKRSTKANAYFTGFGKKKRIVLYDTLINDLEIEEVVAVLAHEIGHYKKKHVLKSLITSILYTGAMLFILSFFLTSRQLAQALGSDIPSFHLGIIAFSVLFSPISLILGLAMNISSRKNEYEADDYAAQFGLSEALIGGLKKLSVKSLSNLNPDPLNVFIYYSHPTLLQRIENLSNK
ncbi:MAG TPA: peptidase M48 [Dysgonomonas sp.]|nr:peptidase M48 [Dysgonomonas sp.]